MIPKRTLTATLEISTGSLILTSRPPAFQGEVHALALVISLLDGGAAYTPTGNVVAQMYLYWPGTVEMTETVPLTISGSTLTGTLPETLTAVPGCPLLVIQITDEDSGDLIVAAASPIQITNVLGGTVISTRPPTPSEIIYVGRSPYIDGVTGNWVQWDTDAGEYVDTGVHAKGDKGDQGIPGPVATVNGVQPDAQGNVQLSGANIPSSAITEAANVDAGLSALSGQIVALGPYAGLDSNSNSMALSASMGSTLANLIAIGRYDESADLRTHMYNTYPGIPKLIYCSSGTGGKPGNNGGFALSFCRTGGWSRIMFFDAISASTIHTSVYDPNSGVWGSWTAI